ncbi:MAG: hypothetical protein MUP67_09825 [Acidimicrobiia bacterium]|nr:hypothetical protein [Acidimicrobiia bacterium]
MSRRRIAIAVLFAVFFVVTNAGAAFAKPLSKQEWRKQVKAICRQIERDGETAIEAALADVDRETGPTSEQFVAAITQFIPVIRAGVTSIAALDEPAAYRKDVKRFRAAVFRGLAVLEDHPSSSDSTIFGAADKYANRLGIGSCP